MQKLTLSADKEVISAARRLAKRGGTSISSLFARFVRALDQPEKRRAKPAPLTMAAAGLLKAKGKFDERKEIENALSEKYGNIR